MAECLKEECRDGFCTCVPVSVPELWQNLADALNALEAAGQLPSCESDRQEVRGSGRSNRVHRVRLSDTRDRWQYVAPVAPAKEQS